MNLRRPGTYGSRIALLAATLLLTTAGCATVVPGEAVRTPADLSVLEVGNYRTEPTEYGTADGEKTARIREGHRLGDHVVLPFEVDPAFTEHVGRQRSVVLDRRAMASLVINDTFDEVAAELVTGWVHTWATAGEFPDRQEMSVAVLLFPDATTAQRVAADLEHDDFTYNTDNRPVRLTKSPSSKAHWQPGTASLVSWTGHDRYVVFVKYTDFTNKADLPAMVRHTETLLEVQLPLLDEFEPTPADRLGDIPLDPDGLLRLAYPKTERMVAVSGPSGVFRGRGALHALSGIADLEFLAVGRVTGIALADTVVMESESVAGAKALWARFRPPADRPEEGRIIDAPRGIDDDVECFSRKVAASSMQSNFCMLRTGRYFALIEGIQVQELHQKTSAQYALLAGS
ncbi:DUF7373 family lipoprotein [Nocardia sp. X0981]